MPAKFSLSVSEVDGSLPDQEVLRRLKQLWCEKGLRTFLPLNEVISNPGNYDSRLVHLYGVTSAFPQLLFRLSILLEEHCNFILYTIQGRRKIAVESYSFQVLGGELPIVPSVTKMERLREGLDVSVFLMSTSSGEGNIIQEKLLGITA